MKDVFEFTQKDTSEPLTKGQKLALENVRTFLNSSDHAFCLTGFAGTGKTFLTQTILQECHDLKLKVALASPTNKAAKVLGQVTGEDAVTVAKLLGLRPKIDQNTGKEIFRKDPDANAPDLDKYDLIIIDEASMVSSELLELLQQEFTLLGPKFLFIGDSAQLPPVGEPNSLVFEQVPNQAHLDEVVRYAGSILNWATALRNQSTIAPVRKYSDDKTLIIKDDKEFAESVITEFTSNQFQSDSDYCRVLAWTNASVNRWNKRIRSAIFGKNASRFVKGEKLVATEACIRETVTAGEREQEVILPSSGEVEVLEAFTERKPIEYGNFHAEIFTYWAIRGRNEDGSVKNFRILAESEQDRFKSMLDHYAKHKEWKDFWALKRAFHSLQYAYALTVHRSQGSTFQKVFLDLRNLLTNRKTNEINSFILLPLEQLSK